MGRVVKLFAWLTIRLLLEVGAVEAVPRACSLLLVVHKEEVEEANTGLRQPGKRVAQVVVTANKGFKFNPGSFWHPGPRKIYLLVRIF